MNSVRQELDAIFAPLEKVAQRESELLRGAVEGTKQRIEHKWSSQVAALEAALLKNKDI